MHVHTTHVSSNNNNNLSPLRIACSEYHGTRPFSFSLIKAKVCNTLRNFYFQKFNAELASKLMAKFSRLPLFRLSIFCTYLTPIFLPVATAEFEDLFQFLFPIRIPSAGRSHLLSTFGQPMAFFSYAFAHNLRAKQVQKRRLAVGPSTSQPPISVLLLNPCNSP